MMKIRTSSIIKRCTPLFLLILIVCTNAQPITPHARSTGISIQATSANERPAGCTVFTVSKGEQVFFGGNGDYIEADSYYWVDPGTSEKYGAIWVGFPDNVQQGVNEKGLAYDANGLPRVDVNSHLERRPVNGGYTSYPVQILRECATVTEVIEWVKTHRWHTYMHDQLHFADISGDAVIISACPDGELAFTRKPQTDGYIVSTNFNVVNPSNGNYPCWRYQTAKSVLEGLVNQDRGLTYQDATGVLDAVHVETGTSWTIVSLLADLPNGLVYLYYFYQFDSPVVLDVAEEIASPRASGPLSSLFPEEVQQVAARRYQRIQAKSGRSTALGMAWLGVVITSLMLFFILSRNDRQGWLFWVPVVTVLGPLALLVWLVARRRRRSGAFRIALVEAIGNVVPSVIAYMIFLVSILLIPAAGSNTPVQIAFIFGLPPVVGWVFFQGPLLSFITKGSYVRTLVKRLPQAWVAANLGMAGIVAIATPLVVENLVFPFSAWTLVYTWALVVLGALVGVLVLLVYEAWALRHDLRTWCVLAWGDGEVASPTWRQLWWWILLSYAFLLGGILGSQLLQQLLA